MSKIGEQFAEFRKTTPKYIQWILMAAAIVVVVVLLMMLVGNRKAQRVIIDPGTLPPTPELIITPDAPVDWSDTVVDEEREAEFFVSANTPVQVTNVVVRVEGDTNDAVGITAIETCKNNEIIIDENVSCTIKIKFQPEHQINTTDAHVAITWSAFDTGAVVDNPNAITLVIGAREKPISRNDAPTPKPNPEPEPEPVLDDWGYDTDFQEDINDIAAPISFNEPEYNAPVATPRNMFKNNCSDFAFPAYNTAGIQSGWIKPMGGAYYYHPFSDTNCDTPTGIYNADTGYIMDINNPTRKIGSDSEHVRFVVTDRLPQLGGGTSTRRTITRAEQLSSDVLGALTPATPGSAVSLKGQGAKRILLKKQPITEFRGYTGSDAPVVSSRPFDRSFVLRQYKPIPATIVSDIQADSKLLESGLPVRATVDRNVYSDNGRTIIIPTGTLMLGYVTGELPGPYKAVGRMQIKWYQFIRPDGVEFNFTKEAKQPFAADSQGRKGVPGHGSTDYLEQFIMPMLTAIVPAAVNMIAPISDAFVNQIDLDNNTVVQSGTVRSSELAKNEIITAWNNVATKLLVDLMDNTTPPFSIAAGTRITVFSPVDLLVTCGMEDESRKCALRPYDGEDKSGTSYSLERGIRLEKDFEETDPSKTEELIGQVRSMLVANISEFCTPVRDTNGKETGAYMANIDEKSTMEKRGYNFNTVDFYCRSMGTYDAINNAKQKAVFENQQQQMDTKNPQGSKVYNEQVLGLKYNDDGSIQNPFKNTSANNTPAPAAQTTSIVTCDGGANPDANGCCPGETYTDMGDQGFNCCPDAGGDCFPPIEL